MSDLRLILLVTGIGVLLGIYLWESWKNKQELRRHTLAPEDPGHDAAALHIRPRTAAGDEDYAAVLADLNNLRTDEPSPAEASAPPHPGPRTAECVIVLHVQAPDAHAFGGADILTAAKAQGFRFGAMNIFHHYGPDGRSGTPPWFSMANMYEPGSFDLAAMEGLETHGLSLFMCLPSPDAATALELMLDTAGALAEALGGEVLDADHASLTPAQVDKLRGIVAAVSDT